MEIDDVFTKAALYETCVKSKILRNIDVDNLDTQTLRALVNRYNALSLREFPIIVTKMMVKIGLTYVVEKMPRLRTYVNPDNVSVQLETDELACLDRTQSNVRPTICTIVAKNIAVSLLGTSIQSLRDLIENTTATARLVLPDPQPPPPPQQPPRQRIRVDNSSVQLQTIPHITTPQRFNNFAAGSPVDLKRTAERRRTASVDSVREKNRTEVTVDRRNRRDALHGIYRAEIHAGDEEDDDEEEVVNTNAERLPSTPPQQLSPNIIISDSDEDKENESTTRPTALRHSSPSINVNEFMSIVETNYTNLLSDEDGNGDGAMHKSTTTAPEFMSSVKTNYTNMLLDDLANGGDDGMHKSSTIAPDNDGRGGGGGGSTNSSSSSIISRRQVYAADDNVIDVEDDWSQQYKRVATTPPPNLTFDDDNDDDDDDDILARNEWYD